MKKILQKDYFYNSRMNCSRNDQRSLNMKQPRSNNRSGKSNFFKVRERKMMTVHFFSMCIKLQLVHCSQCVQLTHDPNAVAQPWPTLCDPMDCNTSGSMRFSRPEYWSGLPFPSPGHLPDQGANSTLLHWEADSSLSHREARAASYWPPISHVVVYVCQ